MHPALAAQLKIDYPHLFRRADVNPDIGTGWEPLLRRLCHALRNEPDVCFAQIKEKFGGLRAYLSGRSETAWETEFKAEAESFLICERCGEDGRLATSGGWIFTSCRECLDVYRADGRPYRWVERDMEEEEEKGSTEEPGASS